MSKQKKQRVLRKADLPFLPLRKARAGNFVPTFACEEKKKKRGKKKKRMPQPIPGPRLSVYPRYVSGDPPRSP